MNTISHFTFIRKQYNMTMQTLHLPPKELIIRLIKDDLINNSLLNGFQTIGFFTENYCLNLSDRIFKAMGISDNNDELFSLYLERCTQLAELNIYQDRTLLEKHAEEIFAWLIMPRNNVKNDKNKVMNQVRVQ